MNQLINVNELSLEEMQLMQTQMINRQLSIYKERIESLENEQNKIRSEVKIAAQQAETQLTLERKRHRTEEHRFGFITQTDLGQRFTVSIGSVYMGNLLRMSGLAKAKESVTEPYREFIASGHAKSDPYGKVTNYKWNPEKCIPKIEKWLEQEGLIDEFYSFDDEKKLHAFIGKLTEKYLK